MLVSTPFRQHKAEEQLLKLFGKQPFDTANILELLSEAFLLITILFELFGLLLSHSNPLFS